MKIKIKAKNIVENTNKETGKTYISKRLWCSVDNKEDANVLAKSAIESGADKDLVLKLIKENNYNGSIKYDFNLDCSNFTFDKVEKYGILDAKVIFVKSEKGFISAKIQVIDKKEQVNGYEPPEEEVTGWNVPSPEDPVVTAPESQTQATKHEPAIPDFEPTDDLPF